MAAEELVARIQADMRNARKGSDKLKAVTLQSVLAEISNAEAVTLSLGAPSCSARIAGASQGVGSTEIARKELTALDILAVLHAELVDLEETLRHVDASTEYAATLHQKIAVLKEYI